MNRRLVPRDTISAAIEAAVRQGRPALVGFLTAGFPTRLEFKNNLAAVAGVCDVVEIGVPFTDPMADGTTIQRASFVALNGGVTLPWILEELKALESRHAAPILLMSYLNPLLSFGLDALPRAAAAAGVAGFIVPDLPFEESEELKHALAREGLALIQMVTPVTPPERLAMLCREAEGFVYAVTLTGTTGAPKGMSAEVPTDVLEYMDRVKSCATVPVCAGFGIRSREQVARFAGHVDGVIVGSALVEVLERGEDVGAFLRSLRAAGSQHQGSQHETGSQHEAGSQRETG
jgi:tryptophan synthase alpha chain